MNTKYITKLAPSGSELLRMSHGRIQGLRVFHWLDPSSKSPGEKPAFSSSEALPLHTDPSAGLGRRAKRGRRTVAHCGQEDLVVDQQKLTERMRYGKSCN